MGSRYTNGNCLTISNNKGQIVLNKKKMILKNGPKRPIVVEHQRMNRTNVNGKEAMMTIEK